MLKVSDIEVSYGDYQVVWGVSFHVGAGEVVSLLGPNGSGKSTIFNTISGLIKPKAGTIEFDGARIDHQPSHEIVGRGLSHILERRRVFPHLSVRQNLWPGGYNSQARPHREETMKQVFDQFPRLRERQSQLAYSLSGGEQQMLALGRGLMSRPKLLMVDEPFLGLSPAVAKGMADALARINDTGVSVLFIEQNVQVALSMSHRGYILESGRLVLSGESETLLKSDEVKRIFLGG